MGIQIFSQHFMKISTIIFSPYINISFSREKFSPRYKCKHIRKVNYNVECEKRTHVVTLAAFSEPLLLCEGLGLPVQIIYGSLLLSLLAILSYLLLRQLTIRNELDKVAKNLNEKIDKKNGPPTDYFELGAILMRKKLYSQAARNLEKCIYLWDSDESELAQVYNALGFAYVELGRVQQAESAFE